MSIPESWRSRRRRYHLEGIVCPNPSCEETFMTGRQVCPHCGRQVDRQEDEFDIYMRLVTGIRLKPDAANQEEECETVAATEEHHLSQSLAYPIILASTEDYPAD